jgi:hypothetical protein
MKTAKFIISITIMLAFLGLNEAVGQWTYNGSHIYNLNSGNVGIGTNSPSYLLHVRKNTTGPTIAIHNSGGIGGAQFEMIDLNSGADWKFKATNNGGFKIRDHGSSLDVIVVEPNSAANCIYVDQYGRVGIGSSSPMDKFHVEGDVSMHTSYPFITLDNTSTSGNAGFIFESDGAYRGWLYYNDASDHLLINAESGTGWRTDLVIKSSGDICMGTSSPAVGYRLSINGKVACEEVLVELDANWPDYVFTQDYNLMSLSDLEKNIRENNHLPGLPSAIEVEENGFHLADMQRRVLEKVEELTLYTIEQGKQIEDLKMKNNRQEEQIQELQQKISRLESDREK